MDLGGHMETSQRESLCAPRPCKRPVPNSEVGPCDRGELEGIHGTAGRESGSGSGYTTLVGPPTQPVILAPVKGVVSGCGPPCSTSRSGNPQADHSGAGGPLQICSTPGGKYPHFC